MNLDGEKYLNIHQNFIRILFKMLFKYFKEFVLKLKVASFVTVWIDESIFNSISLHLYFFIPIGQETEALKDIMLLLLN